MIFVSIAAYRDPELRQTIESLTSNSAQDLHISIVEQCTKRERVDISKFASDRVKFSIQWMHPLQAKGAGYARYLAMQPYDGEDYYLQIDSHTEMIEGWDEKLIAELNTAQQLEGSDKVILSQYPAAYYPQNHKRIKQLRSKKYSPEPKRVIPTVSKRGQIAGKRMEVVVDEPAPSTMVLAGYIFGPGSFTELGYNQDIVFWGEEFFISINSWLNGWRIYAPHEMYVWHHYGRGYHDKVWDDIDNWTELEGNSTEYMMNYFKTMRVDDWNAIHQDHRNTIEAWIIKQNKMRGNKEEITNEFDIDIYRIIEMYNRPDYERVT